MPTTCTGLARAHHEPLAGTAPRTVGWVLLEEPGPWGRKALTSSAFDPDVGRQLEAALKPIAGRPLLIRRPHGRRADPPAATSPDSTERRRLIIAHSGRPGWAEQLWLDNDRDVLSLDLELLLEPTAPGLGPAVEHLLLLACTHAKRDRCCAVWGRPIAQALSKVYPEETWEASHVGGHRFAGNLVVLPEGLYYGGLDALSATTVVGRHVAGRLSPAHLRGRAMWSKPCQAAEVLVRQALAIPDDAPVDAEEVAVEAEEVTAAAEEVTVAAASAGQVSPAADGAVPAMPAPAPPDAVEVAQVAVTTAERRVVVELVREPTGSPRLLSCGSDEPDIPTAWRLHRWITPADPDRRTG